MAHIFACLSGTPIICAPQYSNYGIMAAINELFLLKQSMIPIISLLVVCAGISIGVVSAIHVIEKSRADCGMVRHLCLAFVSI
jgi:hypothetical protein